MSMSTEFKLRYVGARYRGARLPLDVLGDLPAVRDLVAAFAEDEWRSLNPDRKRVPKGFGKALSFSLVRIEDGSAVPCLALDNVTPQPALPGLHAYAHLVEHAFEKVVSLFDDARRSVFPASLSKRHVNALNQFGAALKEGERIEFHGHKDSTGNTISVDSNIRRSLITHISETYHKKIEGFARLIGNLEDGAVFVRDSNLGEIKIQVPPDSVTQIFDGNLGSSVFYSLIVDLDKNDRLKGVSRVEDIGLIDDEMERRQQRLIFIEALKDGWHDGDGSAPSPIALSHANTFVIGIPSDLSNLKIFPTVTGGILFEFVASGWDYSVEVHESGRVEFFGIEIEGVGESDIREFDGITEELLEEIRNLAGNI